MGGDQKQGKKRQKTAFLGSKTGGSKKGHFWGSKTGGVREGGQKTSIFGVFWAFLGVFWAFLG